MDLFTCPVCHERLRRHDGMLKCGASHSFDIAREGYVNLLPVYHRRSRAPGDDREMVAARRRFMESGHFGPLFEALAGCLADTGEIAGLLDVGCGEGSFSHGFTALAGEVYGVDISKPAVKAAATRYKSLHLAVANMTRLPFAADTFDVATVIFAPLAADLARVTKLGGLILRVSPGARHLVEIKERVYRDVRHHRRARLDIAGLKHRRECAVNFEMVLDDQGRSDLLGMTPMQYRTKSVLRDRTIEGGETIVTASFWIDVFERAGLTTKATPRP